MLNVVTSRSRSSSMLRCPDPYVQVRLSTLRKLFAPGLHLVSYMTVSKSRPPNFALTLVNWWSKKPHRTLHHADTDEEMVSQYPAMYYGTQLIKRAIRFRSSKLTLTDQSRKANTSWVDAIGAKSRWRSRRVIYHSTSAWKRRKDMERRSGKAFPLVQFISDLLNPCRYSVRAPAPRWTPTVLVE
jgi:hypothetical protein